MKIKHYICPRACGKTTFAENLQMEDPENTLLFKMDRGYWKWGQNMRGEKWKRIIMDEYILRYNSLRETEKDRFIDWIYSVVLNTLKEDGELILISTPDKLYSQAEMALACLNKRLDNNLSGVININELNKVIDEIDKKFINPLLKGLEIIKTDFNIKRTQEEYKHLLNSLGVENYKTQVLGRFIE